MTSKTAEKKIKIPEDGLAVALNAWNKAYGAVPSTAFTRGLEAFVAWLDRELSDEKAIIAYCDENFKGYDGTAQRIGFRVGLDFVRRMFLAPEPEVPKEIKELIYVIEEGSDIDAASVNSEEANRRIDEAFCRGQQSENKTQTAPEVDHIDYYRQTPGGGYAKMDGPVDVMPETVLSKAGGQSKPALETSKCPHRRDVKTDHSTMERVVYCELCGWEYSRMAIGVNGMGN